MERNPQFLERSAVPLELQMDRSNFEEGLPLSQEPKFKGFDMSNWVIRESLIFLQKLVKCITKKEVSAL